MLYSKKKVESRILDLLHISRNDILWNEDVTRIIH